MAVPFSDRYENDDEVDGDNGGGNMYQLLSTDNAPSLLYTHFLT